MRRCIDARKFHHLARVKSSACEQPGIDRIAEEQHARTRAIAQARLRSNEALSSLAVQRQLQLAKDGGVKPAHQKPASSTQPSCCAKPLQSKPCIAARRVRPGRRATEAKQVVFQEDAAIYTRRAAGTVTAQAAERCEFQVAVSRTKGEKSRQAD